MKELPVKELIEKIAMECHEAGANQWTITKIVRKLSESKEVSITKLRDNAIKLLQVLDPSAATIYSSFHKLKVFTSKEKIQPFDRGNIIHSLLKETKITRGVAEKIGRDVEDKIKDLQVEFLNTALIRELTNVKLMEYGHKNIRDEYARIGLPVFDVSKKFEEKKFYNPEILKEYNILKIIPKKAVKMHFENELIIPFIEDFSSKVFCLGYEVENFSGTYLAKYFNEINLKSTMPSTMFNSNYFIPITKTKKENAINAISEISNLYGKPPTLSLSLFVRNGKTNINSKTDAVILANKLLKEKGKNWVPVVTIDNKFKTKLINEPIFKKEIIFFNSYLGEENYLHPNIFTRENGVVSFTGINLFKLSKKNNGKENSFFKELKEKIKIIKELDLIKRKTLIKRKIFTEKEINKMDSFIGLGLIEKTGNEIFKDKKIIEKIVKETINEAEENFLISEIPIEISKDFNEEFRNKKESKFLLENFNKQRTVSTKKELNELIDLKARIIKWNP